MSILSEIRAHNLELLQVKTDKIRTEQILRILDIENCRVRLGSEEA